MGQNTVVLSNGKNTLVEDSTSQKASQNSIGVHHEVEEIWSVAVTIDYWLLDAWTAPASYSGLRWPVLRDLNSFPVVIP